MVIKFGSHLVMPMNYIHDVEPMGYAKDEKILRCKLAALVRVLGLYDWTPGLGAHVTARLNAGHELFANPFGLLSYDVTASSLNKVDMQGTVVEHGTTNFGVNIRRTYICGNPASHSLILSLVSIVLS